MLLPSSIKVMESISGSVVPLAMFFLLFNFNYWCYWSFKTSNFFSGIKKKTLSFLSKYPWRVLRLEIFKKDLIEMNTKKRKRWIQQVWMERKPNKKNLLLTHWENATLPHKVRSWYFSNGLDMFEMYMHGSCVFNFQGDYVIQYKRINHKDFKFLLKMRNPNRVEKKVIFRLWLVPTNRTSSTARYHPTTGFVNIGHEMISSRCWGKKIDIVYLTGPTTPKKRLPLIALSTSWLETTAKWSKGSQLSLPWPWKKQESLWKCQSKVDFWFNIFLFGM